MLENGHDAVIATVVWFAIGGAPLVILHRLSNTLDAMWGYKNSRFIYFGWFAARMDDFLGWPTAKITSLLYVCQGPLLIALDNAKIQGRQYKSLNGGWVMAAGATVLGIRLGGSASYHGKTIQSVTLGKGAQVSSKDIEPSLTLVSNALLSKLLYLSNQLEELLRQWFNNVVTDMKINTESGVVNDTPIDNISGTSLFKTVRLTHAKDIFEQLCQLGIYVRLCDEQNALRFGLATDKELPQLKSALAKLNLSSI